MKKFIKPVYAHCDGPCGHYETDTLKNSALTCGKVLDKILALKTDADLQNRQQFIRLTAIKEEHAQICKNQVYILWSDYFKPAHYERYPQLANQLYQLAQTCSQVKQTLDPATVEALKEQIEALDEIFQATQAA